MKVVYVIKRFIYNIFQHEKSKSDSWMENEIKIACERERRDSGTSNTDWDYGCACYESAAKAYKSLCKDGHSGFSIGLTRNILNRLIDHKPLTPIEDTPDVWNDISDISGLHGEAVNYQCKRMSSLFKHVYADGTVKYSDIDLICCVDVDGKGTYHSGLVQGIVEEMFPITMPYYPPTHPIEVYCSDCLTDRKNGDFDTMAIFYLVKPSGERVEINRFFKEADNGTGWDEITKEEYNARKGLHEQRVKEEDANIAEFATGRYPNCGIPTSADAEMEAVE